MSSGNVVFIIFGTHNHWYSDQSLTQTYCVPFLVPQNSKFNYALGWETEAGKVVEPWWYSTGVQEQRSLDTTDSKVTLSKGVMLMEVCREQSRKQKHRWRIEEDPKTFYNFWEVWCHFLGNWVDMAYVNVKPLPLSSVMSQTHQRVAILSVRNVFFVSLWTPSLDFSLLSFIFFKSEDCNRIATWHLMTQMHQGTFKITNLWNYHDTQFGWWLIIAIIRYYVT